MKESNATPQDWLQLEAMQEAARVGHEFMMNVDVEEGAVDFFIDGEFILSDPFEKSWDEMGKPTRELDVTDYCAVEKRQFEATSAYHKVAKLKKSEDRFDREMADELEEAFGPGSCFAGSWYRGRALYNDEGKERMFGECGREIREGGWDGEGEPFLD